MHFSQPKGSPLFVMHAAQDIVSPKLRGRKISARRKKEDVQFLLDDDDSDDFTESYRQKTRSMVLKICIYNADIIFTNVKNCDTKKRRKLVAVDDNNIENKNINRC